MTDCIIWTGTKNGDGYGRIGRKFVHRMAFEEAGGVLIKGMEIDHLCGNRACYNAEHLEQVSHKVNTLRGDTITARHARKTHCPRGHAYDEANTYIAKDGSRNCRKCIVIRTREKRLRKQQRSEG